MRPSVLALAVLLLLGPLAPAAPAGGPAEDGPPVARRAGRIEHGGRWRAWHALLPLNHDPGRPVPLVLALHGGGGSGVGFDAVTHGQFTREVARRGWVVASLVPHIHRKWSIRVSACSVTTYGDRGPPGA